jgi:hypothetical protein
MHQAIDSYDCCALACASLAESRNGGRKRALLPAPTSAAELGGYFLGKQKVTRRRHTNNNKAINHLKQAILFYSHF